MTGNSTSARTVTRVAALLEGLVFFVPVFVLGAAIEWPASLDFEPPKLLRLVAENESMTQLGYVVYLIYSLAFWPVIALFGWHALSRTDRRWTPSVIIALIAAGISAAMRSIGILRWLFPMPDLADRFVAASASSEPTDGMVAIFDALNSFGGAVGEVLGVGIFASIAVIAVSLALRTAGSTPVWVANLGVVAGVSLISSAVEIVGIDAGFLLTVSVTILQLWFLAVAFTLRPVEARS
jgi:Domain of unknown function (DUF4386)